MIKRFWPLFKDYAHQISMAVGLFLILTTGLVVDVRLAMGKPFPEGHDTFLWMLAALAGVNVAGIGVIRATGVPYQEAKAAGKAAGAAGLVNVQGDANINQTQERQVPAPSRSTDVKPAPMKSAFGGDSNE
jgi:hypothetical protein